MIPQTRMIFGIEESKSLIREFLQGLIDTIPINKVVRQLKCDLHLVGFGTSDPIASIAFTPGDDVMAVTEDVVARAKSEAEGIGSPKVDFALFVGKERRSFFLRFPEMESKTSAGEFDEPGIVPTAKGAWALQLSQNRDFAKMAIGASADVMRMLKDTIKDQNEEIRALRRERAAAIRQGEELQQLHHERQIQIRQVEKREERFDRVAGTALALMPSAINALASSKILAEPATPIEFMLEGLLDSFTPDQLTTVSTTGQIQLKSEQVIGLLEMFKAMRARAEEAKKNSASETTQKN